MEILMLIGALGFTLFMILCIENMIMFKSGRSKKQEWLVVGILFVIGAIAGGTIYFIGLYQFLFLLLFAFLFIAFSISYKSIKRGVAAAVYGVTVYLGVETSTVLLAQMLGFEIDHIARDILFLGVIVVLFVLYQVLKRMLKKHGKLSIVNHKTMHFLLVAACTTIALIYVDRIVGSPVLFEIALVLYFVAGVVAMVIILRYISHEDKLKAEK